MNAYQPPREAPVYAVLDGFSAAWILAHIDMVALQHARRTWQIQGSERVVLMDASLTQMQGAKAYYVRTSNAGMIPAPVERPTDEDVITNPISTQEAARLLGCSDRNVRDLAARGVIIGKRQGRPWIVSRASVLAYRDTQAEGAEAA